MAVRWERRCLVWGCSASSDASEESWEPGQELEEHEADNPRIGVCYKTEAFLAFHHHSFLSSPPPPGQSPLTSLRPRRRLSSSLVAFLALFPSLCCCAISVLALFFLIY